MKKRTITIEMLILVLIITSITLVSAVSFSPSSLSFNLNPGQQSCQKITFDSTSNIITASDSWAENKNVEWKVSNFKTSASSLGISINYPSQVSSDDKKVEVCISGSNPGEYHGVLILKEEQQGNSIVQMGIWLKIIISGATQQSSSSNTATTTAQSQQQTTNQENEQTNQNQQEQTSPMTGGFMGISSKSFELIILPALTIIIFITLFIFFKQKRSEKRWKEYGY